MGSNAATKLYRVVLQHRACAGHRAAQCGAGPRVPPSGCVLRSPSSDLLAAYRKQVPFVENDQVMYTYDRRFGEIPSNREIVMLLVKNIAKIVGVDRERPSSGQGARHECTRRDRQRLAAGRRRSYRCIRHAWTRCRRWLPTRKSSMRREACFSLRSAIRIPIWSMPEAANRSSWTRSTA